jgi:hypothetical protein
MKTNNRVKNTALAIGALIAIMAIVTLGSVMITLLFGGGVLLANAPAGLVADQTVTTEVASEKSPNLLRPDISKQITKIMPAAAPLDTLIREAGAHEWTKSLDYRFYSSELRPFMDSLSATFTRGAEAATYDLPVTSTHVWQKDDDLIFHDVDGADGLPLVAHIVQVDRANNLLKVVFLNGDNPTNLTYGEGNLPPANITDETKLGRLGNAKSELDAKTDPYGHLPTDAWNYVQAHMAQVQESLWQKIHNKEVDWDIRDQQTLSMFDLRCKMEATSLFGVRRKVFDPIDNDYKYHTGGIIRFVDNKIEIPGGDVTDATFANWTKRIFVGNAGSDRRYMFIGSDLNERLSKVPHISKQIDGKSTEVVYGITFNKIETNFGVLLMRHHQLFNYHGFANRAIVVDMNNIRKRVYESMGVRKLDLMITGEKKANAFVLEETFGLEIRYPGTHAILSPA